MKSSEHRFVVHEGLTDLEQMKLGMFHAVVRNGVRVLLVIFSTILFASLIRALSGAGGNGL